MNLYQVTNINLENIGDSRMTLYLDCEPSLTQSSEVTRD